jgi:hypothetical protein
MKKKISGIKNNVSRERRLGRPFGKLLLFFLTAVFLTHVVFSVFASLVTKGLEEHRLTNVHNFKSLISDPVFRMIASFIESRVDERETIAIVGTSFSWGYAWQENAIFSHHLQKKLDQNRINVVNLSVLGGNTINTLNTLSLLKQLGRRPEYLIIEIHLTGFTKAIEANNWPVADFNLPWSILGYRLPYLDFYLLNLVGTNFLRTIYNQYNYEKPERNYSFVALPAGYFLTPSRLRAHEDISRRLITNVVKAATEISPNVWLLFAPPYFRGIPDTGLNATEVWEAYQMLLELCMSLGTVTCLDFSEFQDKAYYRDVSHLGLRGHAAFVTELIRKMGF